MMPLRKSASVLFLGVLPALLLGLFLGRNALLRWAIEDSISSITRAEVTVKQAQVDLSEGVLRFGSLHVQNRRNLPQNMLVSAQGELDFDGWALLRGKLVVSTLSLKEVRFAQPRNPRQPAAQAARLQRHMQALVVLPFQPALAPRQPNNRPSSRGLAQLDPSKKTTAPKESLTDVLSQPKCLDKVNLTLPGGVSGLSEQFDARALLKRLSLASLETHAKLNADKQNLDTWRQAQAKKNFQAAQQALQKRWKAWRATGKNALRSLHGLKELSTILKEARTLQRNLSESVREFSTLQKAFRQHLKDHQQALGQDKNKLFRLAGVDAGGSRDWEALLLGPIARTWTEKILEVLALAQCMLAGFDEDPNLATRRQGKNIVFASKAHTLPAVWLRQVSITGYLPTTAPQPPNAHPFSARLQNLRSDSHLQTMPVLLDAKAEKGRGGTWTASARFKGKPAPSSLDFAWQGRNIALGEVALGGGDWPEALQPGPGHASLKARVRSGLVMMTLNLQTPTSRYRFGAGNSAAVRQAFGSTKGFRVNINATGPILTPSLRVNSNLGGIVQGLAKGAARAKVAQKKQALQAALLEKLGGDANHTNTSSAFASSNTDLLAQQAAASSVAAQAQNTLKNGAKNEARKKLSKKLKSLFN